MFDPVPSTYAFLIITKSFLIITVPVEWVDAAAVVYKYSMEFYINLFLSAIDSAEHMNTTQRCISPCNA